MGGNRMITIRQKTSGLQAASRIFLVCVVHASYAVAAEPRPAQIPSADDRNTRFSHLTTNAALRRGSEAVADSRHRHFQNIRAQSRQVPQRDLKFTNLTTKDGLSQSNVTAILQDRRGFMWFATRDGLNRYDGNTFVVYKHNPNDPGSLSANFVQDLLEDDQGYLWIATLTGGVNRFDPTTEHFTRYRHDPSNPNSLSGDSVDSIAQDSRGYFWFGTIDSGLDKFDAATGIFTHYVNDSDGLFVGRITHVTEDSHRDIWFVGDRGLFHLNPATGQITRPPPTRNGLGADYVYEDSAGNLWMLAYSPIVGLVKYDRQAQRLAKYPVAAGAVGIANSRLMAEGQNGLWVPSSQGLYYFDRQTERFKYRFQHDERKPDSLNDNAVVSVLQDRGGLLWVGTENGGLNVLNFRQQQFGLYQHHPGDPGSPSSGRVTAIYEEPNGILWVGFFPRALDRLNRNTGQVTHYVPGLEGKSALGRGSDLNSICKDERGYVWLGGWNSGLDRFDERTGQFKHYRHKPDDPNSLISNNVFRTYADRSGQLWIGQDDGVSRLDPATERFTNYRSDPRNPSYGSSADAFYRDRSGTLWVGRGGGVLSRFDDKAQTFVYYSPETRDPHKLQGGGITAIYEDQTGTLWLGAWDGLYWYSRKNGTFTRYTESDGLPSSAIQGILEDKLGYLWLSTKKGISRFDPRTETFKNYDVSDGLQGDEFSQGAYAQGPDGEMFFGGSNGFNAFFPENVRDNPYVPPVVITSFKIFNKSVPIGPKSVLNKAIALADSLTLSYRDSVFSFEFAALSYANSHKNRYRYKLEGFEPGWNEVGSKQHLATYTNLEPSKYVFRVQGSNSDGVWNEQGVSLKILITPPWWNTILFRAVCAAVLLALIWAAHRLRVRQLHHEFEMTLEARVGERTRIARDLHDTLLQSFQALLLRFQAGINMLAQRPADARRVLEDAVDRASQAIAEGRDAIGGLRMSTVEKNDLTVAIKTIAEELAKAQDNQASNPFQVLVEGTPRELHPILRDEVYRLVTEGLRNSFRHAAAQNVEVEIRYDEKYFRVRVRDDGKGIPSEVLRGDGREGHYGLPGMRERAKLVGGKLTIWTELDSGTEIELVIPGARAYVKYTRPFWYFEKRSATETDKKETIERE
jgi:ligand-binding sensor domain-containing protein/signal transduction histidine kinase